MEYEQIQADIMLGFSLLLRGCEFPQLRAMDVTVENDQNGQLAFGII